MPRGPREIYEDAILNVTSRGNNKKIIFKKDKDYIYFKNLLFKYKMEGGFKIYHYCLMRNHVHILLKVTEPSAFSRAMKGLQLSYFHYFQRRYSYVGRFWQGRFHSKLVENETYLLRAGLYIEANPIRANIVKSPDDSRWSSYNVYANGAKDILVDWDPYYLSLDGAIEKKQLIYRDIMQTYLGSENTRS